MLSYCYLATLFPFGRLYFYEINLEDEEACERKICFYGFFSSLIHIYQERRKLNTYYLQDRDSTAQK